MASAVSETETLQAVVGAVVIILEDEPKLEAPAARDFVDGKGRMIVLSFDVLTVFIS